MPRLVPAPPSYRPKCQSSIAPIETVPRGRASSGFLASGSSRRRYGCRTARECGRRSMRSIVARCVDVMRMIGTSGDFDDVRETCVANRVDDGPVCRVELVSGLSFTGLLD